MTSEPVYETMVLTHFKLNGLGYTYQKDKPISNLEVLAGIKYFSFFFPILIEHSRTLVKSATKNLFFLFLSQNICCGYSKERFKETVLLSTQTYVKIDG